MFGQTIDLKNNKKDFPFINFMVKQNNARFYLDFNDLLLFLKNRNVNSEIIKELTRRGGEAYDLSVKRNNENRIITENLKKDLEEIEKNKKRD